MKVYYYYKFDLFYLDLGEELYILDRVLERYNFIKSNTFSSFNISKLVGGPLDEAIYS